MRPLLLSLIGIAQTWLRPGHGSWAPLKLNVTHPRPRLESHEGGYRFGRLACQVEGKPRARFCAEEQERRSRRGWLSRLGHGAPDCQAMQLEEALREDVPAAILRYVSTW